MRNRYAPIQTSFTIKYLIEYARGSEYSPIRQFRLSLPQREGHGYTQNVAFDTFFDTDRHRSISPTHIYTVQDTELDPQLVPTIDLIDMWDFYRLIGFDHKNKCWKCEEERSSNQP